MRLYFISERLKLLLCSNKNFQMEWNVYVCTRNVHKNHFKMESSCYEGGYFLIETKERLE